jgi:nitrogenase molybdenum-cofactor synthesis protein NifE
MGYRLACEAIMKVISKKSLTNGSLTSDSSLVSVSNLASDSQNKQYIDDSEAPIPNSVNILGDYNLAGEAWIIENYFREMGLTVLTTFTGDSTYKKLLKSRRASLNIVQCAGSMMYLARSMEEQFGLPFIRGSFFGLADTSATLMKVADLLGDQNVREKTAKLCRRETERVTKEIEPFLPLLKGKKAAIFVGGGFKAISLMRQFKELGMETVLVGTQTGTAEDYEIIEALSAPGTVILDDANPSELETFMREKGADILVGGVKERPLAFKLGVAFCDHNHERKMPLAGFEGVVNFTKEINLSINSPVWGLLRQKANFTTHLIDNHYLQAV